MVKTPGAKWGQICSLSLLTNEKEFATNMMIEIAGYVQKGTLPIERVKEQRDAMLSELRSKKKIRDPEPEVVKRRLTSKKRDSTQGVDVDAQAAPKRKSEGKDVKEVERKPAEQGDHKPEPKVPDGDHEFAPTTPPVKKAATYASASTCTKPQFLDDEIPAEDTMFFPAVEPDPMGVE